MAAAIGNRYSLGCANNGAPPIYKDPLDLEKKIIQYFDCEEERFTITGLCLFCGFESRQSFYDYEKREEFSYIIKRSRTIIENMYEQKLQTNSPTGAIFALKNMGWDDKQQIEHSGTSINITVSKDTGKGLGYILGEANEKTE